MIFNLKTENYPESDVPSVFPSKDSDSYCCKVELFNILDKPCFLEQLRIERYRAQRSKTDLSLLLIKKEKNSSLNFSGVLKILGGIIRETDSAGYIDHYTLGILLPYTDQDGLKKIVAKIYNCFIKPQFTIETATFPDQVFDYLAKTGCVSSDVLKIMLEETIDNSQAKLFLKRAVDIVGSIIALIIFSPVMLVTAICVKISSPGPIIFCQKRLGAKAAPFDFYKFRSMRVDSNDQIHREFVLKLIDGQHSSINNGNSVKPLYKMKSDPRITAIGKIIRKTSIDELPQLFNVLKGDMSLVGPRPPLSYEAEKYQAWHLRRILEMKPGITGLWQVEGRSRTGFDDSVRLDIKYLQKWSLFLDLNILLKTVKEVLNCRGAF